jgi:PleD family two-component response regulator
MSTSKEKDFKVIIATEVVSYRNNLATTLRVQGFTVELVTGGFHLLSLLEQDASISLIIVHENMHDMSAYEIISMIRTIKSRTELPTFIVSKVQNPEDVKGMVDAGANEFILQTPGLQPIIEKTKKYYALKTS